MNAIKHRCSGQDLEPHAVGFSLEVGERILWQGRPEASSLLRHLLKVHWLVAYVSCLLLWKLVLVLWVRGLSSQEVIDAATLVVQAIVLAGIAAFFAWALARATTYTLTDLRLVVRHGIALPGTVDIPLRALRGVAVRVHGDGTGDVALRVRDGGGVGFAKLWPNARGIALSRPVPMLRGVRDAAVLGTTLARLLSDLHGESAVSRTSPVPVASRAA